MEKITTFRIDKNLKEEFRISCEKKYVSCSDIETIDPDLDMKAI